MTSDSGGDSSGDWRPDKRPDTRTRLSILFAICVTINTCILSREPRPAQRGGYYEKSLIKIAAVLPHCVFLLPLEGSSRRKKQDEGYRSALGLHKVVSQPCHGSVQYWYRFTYDSRSKTLLQK